MLTSELLINKGFKLNSYPEGKFYELEAKDENTLSKILGDNYMGDEEWGVLQIDENFKNAKLCVDCDTWDLTNDDFEKFVNKL